MMAESERTIQSLERIANAVEEINAKLTTAAEERARLLAKAAEIRAQRDQDKEAFASNPIDADDRKWFTLNVHWFEPYTTGVDRDLCRRCGNARDHQLHADVVKSTPLTEPNRCEATKRLGNGQLIHCSNAAWHDGTLEHYARHAGQDVFW